MQEVNHECYVDLEVAKLLKEAGFDWSCRGYYDRQILRFNFVWDHNGKGASTQCSAPTLDVAQRWLREVMNIDVYIFPDTNVKRECVYQVGLKTFGRTLWMPGQPSTAQYNTYEEAQESGIKKALEIILECK